MCRAFLFFEYSDSLESHAHLQTKSDIHANVSRLPLLQEYVNVCHATVWEFSILFLQRFGCCLYEKQ